MSVRKLRILVLRLSSIPLIFLAVFVRPSWSVESNAAFTIEFAGYLFLLGGLGVRMWSTLYIGGRKSQTLITDGPYSICRNPLYIGTLLLVIGIGLCFENPLMLVATAVVVIPIHIVVARMEERHLESKFPQEYPSYKRQVPLFLPRLRGYRSEGSVVVSVRSIRRVALDTMGVLLIPEIEDLLELLHQHEIIPVLWHFP